MAFCAEGRSIWPSQPSHGDDLLKHLLREHSRLLNHKVVATSYECRWYHLTADRSDSRPGSHLFGSRPSHTPETPPPGQNATPQDPNHHLERDRFRTI